ncbi:ABC transporter ATP-binding protein [Thauera sinica]|uniref:ABC transporter ATP-binding protein n=1 Tax=Thauera sinica TaxID=2665146 RepID=A0ABW1APS0_9RHOO|nr:ABC transporter ATP-binding protein [Thauera sp. K11]ATE62313.1 ABC transporter ATP-binding protein [Thauera sp. K11]
MTARRGAEAPLLEAEGLALQVGGRWLCCEFSLTLAAGECLALLGPNGAGKTTLLHTLAGLREPTAGRVRIGGRPYAAWPAPEAARFRGLLAQQQPDHFAASVLETVLIGRHPHLGRWGWEGAEDERIARDALAAVGLAGFAQRDVLTLSGGERQRVAIAALLVQAPRLYLLDEPLNHLDLHHQIATLDMFRRLVREDAGGPGRGVVMVLHDIDLAARYADHVILLDGRGGVRAGERDSVLRPDLLSHAFGHPLRRYEVDGRVTFIPD